MGQGALSEHTEIGTAHREWGGEHVGENTWTNTEHTGETQGNHTDM